MVRQLYDRLLVTHWEQLNREAEVERRLHPGFDGRAVATILVVAAMCIFQEYFGERWVLDTLFHSKPDGRYHALLGFAWWSGAKVLGYLIVPCLTIKAWGGRLSDFGLGLRGFGQHVWIYAALFAAVLPVVVIASYTHPFQATYPFYKSASRSWFDLLAWEALYGVSFFALEFFFRGFSLFALKRSLGGYAVLAMMVPYCMIHFHKPIAETCGAVIAGLVLGTLAMVTRSIWCGVLIHLSVAWTMDFLALLHTTGLPGSGRFVG
jgi:hypothetical protein